MNGLEELIMMAGGNPEEIVDAVRQVLVDAAGVALISGSLAKMWHYVTKENYVGVLTSKDPISRNIKGSKPHYLVGLDILKQGDKYLDKPESAVFKLDRSLFEPTWNESTTKQYSRIQRGNVYEIKTYGLSSSFMDLQSKIGLIEHVDLTELSKDDSLMNAIDIYKQKYMKNNLHRITI
jgi:hypothetical protein